MKNISTILSGDFNKPSLVTLRDTKTNHKSTILQNLAINASNNGKNVLYITNNKTSLTIMSNIGLLNMWKNI